MAAFNGRTCMDRRKTDNYAVCSRSSLPLPSPSSNKLATPQVPQVNQHQRVPLFLDSTTSQEHEQLKSRRCPSTVMHQLPRAPRRETAARRPRPALTGRQYPQRFTALFSAHSPLYPPRLYLLSGRKPMTPSRPLTTQKVPLVLPSPQ